MNKEIININFQDNPELFRANLIVNSGKNLFLTGKAGAGKTYFIKWLIQEMKNRKKNVVVAAPTGIAAINIGGQTLHSLFGLPTSPYLPDTDAMGEYLPASKRNPSVLNPFNKPKINLIKNLELLIIDEISMVRADVLDMISDALCCFRNSSEPFGGVQLLMVGDLFQLPPVAGTEWSLLSQKYDTEFFFSSLALKKCNFECVQLNKIYRQNDPDFIRILNNIRLGFYSERDFLELNTRYFPRQYGEVFNTNEMVLCSRKDEASRINETGLLNIPGDTRSYVAQVDGKFPSTRMPCESTLNLKIGAKVMITENNWEDGYQNGTLGIVENMTDTSIFVRLLDDGRCVPVYTKQWENIEYSYKNGQIVQSTIGTCEQFPLRLAWAITIHKSQGLTFDQVTINPSCIFAEGQLYVALSRARSIQGIRLLSRITKSHLKISGPVLDFYLRVFGADMMLSDM